MAFYEPSGLLTFEKFVNYKPGDKYWMLFHDDDHLRITEVETILDIKVGDGKVEWCTSNGNPTIEIDEGKIFRISDFYIDTFTYTLLSVKEI